MRTITLYSWLFAGKNGQPFAFEEILGGGQCMAGGGHGRAQAASSEVKG